jgi:C-terminal processing protease CtpA/Prc
MSRNVFKLLFSMIALGAGLFIYLLIGTPSAPPGKPQRELRPVSPVPAKVRIPVPVSTPAPAPPQAKTLPPVRVQTPKTRPGPEPRMPIKSTPAQSAWWEQQLRRFNRLKDALSRETDPNRRRNLIRQLGAYVRVDTLSSLEWAMGLIDPEEKRTALDSINRHALVGIGARIEVDRTGFPKIRETTVMSAVAATGRVNPGDYIVGMEDENGQVLSFKNLPAAEIVQRLRGEAGSELRLLMERAPSTETEAYPYEVTIQRSLLVIQPP